MYERLTYRYGENNEHADFITIKKDGYARYRASCEGALKLAAYEDSGLSPEHTHELAKAKAEGRLYILPVKVGDTVYFASHLYEKVEEYQVTEITNPIYDITVIAREHQYIAPIPLCSIADIGKTVFLTREEAEAALKGAEHDRD